MVCLWNFFLDALPDSAHAEQDPKAAALLVSQISEWEQNWLFKRRKQLFKKRNLLAEAVPMLVPNPNEEGVEPQVGAEKASDLSDLSDHVNDDEDDGFLDSSSEEEEEQVPKDEVKDTVVKPEASTSQIEVAAPPQPTLPKKTEIIIGDKSRANGTSKPEKPTVMRNGSIPKKPERKLEKGISFLTTPHDCQVAAGRTAKFLCAIGESSPAYSNHD